ncbi:uncharacterized protein LOC128093819 [Culex pipiens pallens]|uniref:uncharacterized protein LOC128093819 n=1 Tax=Culex pipiens pallens TaxID=42434 RepID=UPI0022AABBBE|nr:uncharacterized protein LOC128093819 [Culex pipiens pallens]
MCAYACVFVRVVTRQSDNNSASSSNRKTNKQQNLPNREQVASWAFPNQRKVVMDLSTTENPEDAIRQLQEVEQKVDFVENTFLCLPEPVLAHLTVLEGFLRAAKREHNKRRLQFVSLVPEAIEQVEEEMGKFWIGYKEVNYTLAMKLAAAKQSSVSPPGEADQIAAEAWLTQQFKAWESLQADIPEHTIESQQARSQTLESQEVAAQDCPLPTDSNQPSSCNSQPREIPAKNARVDSTSDALIVANHGPQEPAEAVAPEDHPASTGSPKDVTASVKHNELLSVVVSCQVPCLFHPNPIQIQHMNPNPRLQPDQVCPTGQPPSSDDHHG